MTDLTAKLVLTGDGSGAIAAATGTAAALDKVKASAAGVASGNAAMTQTFNAAQAALQGQTAAATAAAKASGALGDAQIAQFAALTQQADAANNVIARISQLTAGQSAYNSTINEARALLASGILNQAQYGEAVEAASAKLALARAASDANSASFVEQQAAAAAIGVGLVGLGEKSEEAVLHVRSLETELGRLGIAGGLARGAVEAVKASVAIIIENPVIAGVVALAAAFVGLAYEENIAQAASLNLALAVTNTGNYVGLTKTQLASLTAQIATTADVSNISAEKIAASFAAGKVDPSLWNQASDEMRGYAVVLGTTVVDASQKFAKQYADGVTGLHDFEQALGGVPEPIAKMADSLVESGEKAAAWQLILDTLKAKADQSAQDTTFFAQAWDGLTRNISNAANALERYMQDILHWSTLGAVPYPSTPGDGVTDDPTAAAAAAQQAKNNQIVTDAATLSNSLNPYRQQLATLSAETKQYTADLKEDGLTAAAVAQIHQTLNDISIKTQQVRKAETDALLNLNEVEKAHLDTIKSLINGSQEVISLANDDATALEAQATASNGTALSVKALQEQYDIQKATQPYVTALTWAHGAAADRLRAIIDQLTASMQRQKAAQDQITSLDETQSKFSSLSTIQNSNIRVPTTDTGFIANTSTEIFNANAGAETEWYNNSTRLADQWLNSQDDVSSAVLLKWQQWRDQLGLIFNSDMAKFYQDDLARRTDWASGVTRGQNDLIKSTTDWASTSESLYKAAEQEAEDSFVQLASGGKNVLLNFFQWIEQQLLKLFYQQFIAGAVNNALGGLIGDLGGFFGSTGGTSTISDFGGSTFGVGHSGMLVGGPAPAYRNVHPAYFDNAPRFHLGGLAGDEVPIIAKKGERILNVDQTAEYDAGLSRPIVIQLQGAGGNSGGMPPVSVNIHNAPGTQATAGDPKRNSDGSMSIDVMVSQIDKALAAKSNRGRSVFTQSLENTHNIRRTPQG